MTNDNENILPEEPNMAVQKMIELTQECLNILEGESEKLTRNDLVQFAVNDEQKGRAFTFYEKASEEFKARIDALRGKVDPSLVTQLQQLQLKVADQAAFNNQRLEQIEGLIKKEG